MTPLSIPLPTGHIQPILIPTPTSQNKRASKLKLRSKERKKIVIVNEMKEMLNKAQADTRARAQAEAQRKEAEERLNLSDDLIHPVDDYF